jgi:hypothetical protein
MNLLITGSSTSKAVRNALIELGCSSRPRSRPGSRTGSRPRSRPRSRTGSRPRSRLACRGSSRRLGSWFSSGRRRGLLRRLISQGKGSICNLCGDASWSNGRRLRGSTPQSGTIGRSMRNRIRARRRINRRRVIIRTGDWEYSEESQQNGVTL